MKPLTAQNSFKSENTRYCALFVTCLVSILEAPRHTFGMRIPDDDLSGDEVESAWDEFYQNIDDKLRRDFQMQLLTLEAKACEEAQFWPQGYHLIVGHRGAMEHVVVGRVGQLAHDPAPDGSAAPFVPEQWVILVPLDPARAKVSK